MTHKGWRVVKPQLNQKKILFLPCPSLISPLLSLLSLFSLSLEDDIKWPTRVDVSLNPSSIKKNPLSSLSLSYISSTISFLPFSRRWHKMTQKGWRVVKSQHRLNVSIRTLSSFQNSFTCWRQICDFFFFFFFFFFYSFIFPAKYSLTFRANCFLRRRFAWYVKRYFLGKKENYSKCKLPSVENINQQIFQTVNCHLLKILTSILSVKALLYSE